MMAANEGMINLIAVVNEIQNAVAEAGLPLESLDLPQIAVVGGQSSGKSSVLENFVGRDFLPRGTGIVTRCPLIFQMIPDSMEYAEFSHLPNQKFNDFKQVEEEISKRTKQITNSKTAISHEPIRLKWFSPSVLELTLVDLPGMTRVPVEGQPEDIEEQIKDLVKDYIQNSNTLILAVTPANQDIANSDALKIAHEVDPGGTRTIGVITKLDLMDKGTDARKILDNKAYPLRKGYIGLVNRSQKDIDEKKVIAEAQEDEMSYFRDNSSYSGIAERMGSRYLQKKLNKELLEHIQKRLPEFRASITKQNSEIKQTLTKLNYFDGDADAWRKKEVISLLTSFGKGLTVELEGHSYKIKRNKAISCGVRINECFHQQLSKLLKEVAPMDQDLKLDDLQKNLQGYRDTLHPPEELLEITVNELLTKYQDPMNVSVDDICLILAHEIETFADAHKLSQYPKLKMFVMDEIHQQLKMREEKTKEQLTSYLEAQRAYINHRHPVFQQAKRTLGYSSFYAGMDQWNSTESITKHKKKRKEFFQTVKRAADAASMYGDSEELIHTGRITVVTVSGMLRELEFFLTANELAWQIADENVNLEQSPRKQKPSGSTSVKGLKLEEDAKTKRYFFSKSKETTQTEICFLSDKDTDDWCVALANVGVEVHRNAQVIKESNGTGEMEKTIQMIKDYMEVVEMSIRDIVPKYIILFLVRAIIDYVADGDLMAAMMEEDCVRLMEGNEVEVEKEILIQRFKATEKALQILRSVSMS